MPNSHALAHADATLARASDTLGTLGALVPVTKELERLSRQLCELLDELVQPADGSLSIGEHANILRFGHPDPDSAGATRAEAETAVHGAPAIDLTDSENAPF